MSLQWIARELYRLEKEVDSLEKAIGEASVKKGEKLRMKLLQIRAERDHMRGILKSKKEKSPIRRF